MIGLFSITNFPIINNLNSYNILDNKNKVLKFNLFSLIYFLILIKHNNLN